MKKLDVKPSSKVGFSPLTLSFYYINRTVPISLLGIQQKTNVITANKIERIYFIDEKENEISFSDFRTLELLFFPDEFCVDQIAFLSR